MNRIIGTSGAQISIMDDGIVWKEERRSPGRERVVTQGQFMWDHQDKKVFPRVYGVTDTGYSMELLRPITPANYQAMSEFVPLAIGLCTRLWGEPHKVDVADVLGEEHLNYMLDRWGPYADVMGRWYRVVRTLKVTAASEIHGDATLDNMMLAGAGIPVLIDPIPATPRMPALIAVDIAKVMQSLWGYESLIGKFHIPQQQLPRVSSETLLRSFPLSDQRLSKYMLACHIARLIPYQSEGKKLLFWDVFTRVIDAYYFI